ncbi:MAG: general secretion pathway protein GspK [Ramlibacter sp.]|nr:general secretion pathway protein GspK [Ramlibacter sp.]
MRRHSFRQRGYVLALNIAVLAMLLVAAAFVGQSVSEAVALARQQRENQKDEVRLESVRSRALFLLTTASRSQKGLGDGTQTVVLDGRAYAAGDDILVSFQDVQGLVPLNGPSLTSPSTGRIERLLGTYGVDEAKATSLAEALLDYRDEDNLRRLNGAEDVEYSLAGVPAALRNRDLLDPFEVRRVLGWRDTSALWGEDPITSHLSVSRHMAFNPNVAGWRALVAAAGIDERTARELVEKRRSGEIADIAGLAFSGGVGDPFGSNAFVTLFPSASTIVTLRPHRAQWGYQFLVHHTPIEGTSPWRVETARRVHLGLPAKPYAQYPELPDLKALGGAAGSSPIKLIF